MPDPIQLGPWNGVDTFHDTDHAVYQVGRDQAPRLRASSNIDLDDEGWPYSRAGSVLISALSQGISAYPFGTKVLVQDGATIKLIDPASPTPTTIASGLSGNRIFWQSIRGRVFWTDGSNWGMVKEDGTNSNWGQAVPASPTLNAVAGNLVAGRYRVTVDTVDANGVESGAPPASVIDVTDNQAIQVGISTFDANAVSARIFVSAQNSKDTRWQKTVPMGDLPTTVNSIGESSEQPWSQHYKPAITGLQGLSRFKGYLLAWRDKYLMRTNGIQHHLFNLRTHKRLLPGPVMGAAAVADGLWVSTTGGMFWYGGSEPENWQRIQKDDVRYAPGHAVYPGREVPFVETTEGVAFFACQHGLALGLPGGTLLHPHKDQYRLNVTNKRASIILARKPRINQILLLLR